MELPTKIMKNDTYQKIMCLPLATSSWVRSHASLLVRDGDDALVLRELVTDLLQRNIPILIVAHEPPDGVFQRGLCGENFSIESAAVYSWKRRLTFDEENAFITTTSSTVGTVRPRYSIQLFSQ